MKHPFLPKILEGTGSRRYSVERQLGASGTEVHWHDCVEIIYMVRGSAEVFFGNQWHSLYAGDLVLLPPGRVHCCRCEDPEAEKIVAGFNENMLTDGQEENRLLLPLWTAGNEKYCIFRDLLNSEIHSCLDRLSKLDFSSPVAGLCSTAEILRLYSGLYLRWMEIGLVSNQPIRSDLVLRIQERIHEDISVVPTAEEMAGELNISYSYMCHVLRENLHMSYRELVNHARVELAEKLLLTTEKSVTEIGLDCGFCDAAYFIKIFRRLTGETPKKFRTFRLLLGNENGTTF